MVFGVPFVFCSGLSRTERSLTLLVLVYVTFDPFRRGLGLVGRVKRDDFAETSSRAGLASVCGDAQVREGHLVDALASRGDEGRDTLR